MKAKPEEKGGPPSMSSTPTHKSSLMKMNTIHENESEFDFNEDMERLRSEHES